MSKHWIFADTSPDATETLARHLGVSRLTAGLLVNRGQTDPAAARRFLAPVLTALQDPVRVEQVRRAAGILADAVRAGRKITVYGDYDADGITAAALLIKCLRCAGAEPAAYVPLRETEGYGLHADALRQLRADGTEVVVTVDCGITALDEARLARELGLTLIVTDHHEPLAEPPDAAAVINPKLPGSGFACAHLSGVGVAFKLAWALARDLSGTEKVTPAFRDFLVSAVSLVALGTIADVAPLQDENRVFAFFGLKALAECTDPGIRALLDVARLAGKSLSTFDVGFKLAPRLNAAGRMDDARLALELLLTDDAERAAAIARELDAHNTARQQLQRLIVAEATAQVEKTVNLDSDRFIVLASETWKRGVVGIVASKIVEAFCRPTVIMAIEDGIAHGSGRSIGTFNLYEALQACDACPDAPEERFFRNLGGHERAAGLSLDAGKLEQFRVRINRIASERLTERDLMPTVRVDLEARLDELSLPVLREIRQLSPFGEGNPRPVLASRGLRVVGNPQFVGAQQRHVSFLVRQGNTSVRVIAFDRRDIFPGLTEHREGVDLAYEPRINEWNGGTETELLLKDIQWSP